MNRSNIGWIFFWAAFFLLGILAGGHCATVTARVDSSTSYMYRGVQVENNAVLQPSLAVAQGPLVASVWVNYNLKVNEYDEIDLFASVSKKVGKLNATVGSQAYFIFDVFNTYDISLTLNHDSLKYVNVVGVYDFGQWDGFYSEVNVAPTFPLSKVLTLSTTAGMGYNKNYMRLGAGASHAFAQASMSYQWTKHTKWVILGYHQEHLSNDFSSVTMGQISFVRDF